MAPFVIIILLKQHRLINLTRVEGIEYEARSHTAQVMMEELAGTFGRNIMSDKAPQYGGRDWAPCILTSLRCWTYISGQKSRCLSVSDCHSLT